MPKPCPSEPTMSLPAAPPQPWLSRDALGRLQLHPADGSPARPVVPVRAFPLAAPREGLSLVGPDGHELAWVEQLDALPPGPRALIEAELAERECRPVLLRLRGVSSFSTPSTWAVDTDRGPFSLVLKGEEDIRRLPDGGLLITDRHGLGFLLPEPRRLDRASRRLLDRFL